MRRRWSVMVTIIVSVFLVVTIASGCCVPGFSSNKAEEKKDATSGEKSGKDGSDTGKKKDVSGEDVTDAPRYPDSILIDSVNASSGETVIVANIYEVEEFAKKVISWYKDKMPSLGWNLVTAANTGEEGAVLMYDRQDEECTITVDKTGEKKTKITINYSKNN